jgi:hypothetical protein
MDREGVANAPLAPRAVVVVAAGPQPTADAVRGPHTRRARQARPHPSRRTGCEPDPRCSGRGHRRDEQQRPTELRLAELTRGRIESFLDAKQKEGPSAQTVNHLRGFLSRAFSAAIDRERWQGKNPVAETAKRQGPKRLTDFLRFEEVAPSSARCRRSTSIAS